MIRPLLALVLLAGALFGLFRANPLTTDMADFLPAGRTEASAFLFRELRNGAATTVLLAGIEGAPQPELARLSRAVGDALRTSGRFSFVGNGTQDLTEAELNLLFAHRYLLSPTVTPALFETAALHDRLVALLAGLRSSASPLLVRFGFADPVNAFFDLVRGWLGDSRVQLRDGAWFADTPPNTPPRALLVARTRAAGLDIEAQRGAIDAFQAAFAAAHPGPARLLVSGPGVFAAEAADAIRGDIRLISILSGVLIAGFLWWRTRSLRMLLLVAVPLVAGTLAGALAVTLAYGTVHGAAFGFGMTMLGVTVDYPILLITLRIPGETLAAAARRIWPSLRLAAAAAALGLTAMLASGFAELGRCRGLSAAAGLITGALVTRWGLPWLAAGHEPIAPRPLPAAILAPLLALRRHRRAALVLVAAAALLLVVTGGPRQERDIAALNPVPQAARDLDQELRNQLGAPDLRTLVAVHAGTAEAVLQGAERVATALAPLLANGALGGLDQPSRYLPSAATQRARAAALPDPETLRPRLAEAAEGMPFRPDAFAAFLAGIATSRTMPPLGPDDLAAAPTLSARLDPLLFRRGAEWIALVVPGEVRDDAALHAAIDALHDPAILFIDIKAETEGVLTAYAGQAMVWGGVGALGVLAVLAIGLGGIRPALGRAVPVAGALLLTVALLTLAGVPLTLFHLVSLLLLAGVAMDYALFLARSGSEAPAEAARTLESVLNCAVATLLSFGLLTFCGTPVLRSIGVTVALGVLVALPLACALAPPLRAAALNSREPSPA